MAKTGASHSEVVQMSENTQTVEQGTEQGTEQGNTGTSTGTATTVSTSVVDLAIEAVMDMIDALNLYATITRGALGIGNSLCCEIAPSMPQEVYLDKNSYIPLTLAINGKHDNLQTLSNALNTIQGSLSRKTTYTSGTGWQIVDITSGNLPRVIGREDNNSWVMACDLIVKIYRKDE